ncbi:MAG: 1-acyl-sn-glycerol-3-phosphate acyltransferase [Balneolaceae bacterium]|nr:MAG: 1-acyl-sn-glycerol-3-phosphate acyltransferase [Balneolaceae bacterium]
MIRHSFALFRTLLFPVLTLGWYLIYIGGLPLVRIRNKRFETWRNQSMKLWGKSVLCLYNMKLQVEGPVPEPPFLHVSNHLSYMDIPVYSAVLETTFISKSEVRNWPLIGYMAHSLGIVFIDRRKKNDIHRVNEEITKQINPWQGVLFFPEGTTSPGLGVMRFRNSLLDDSAQHGRGVTYSSIRYETTETDVPAYKSVCWWGGVHLLSHIYNAGKNRKVIVEVRFGSHPLVNRDRKMLGEELQKAVENIFVPVAEKIPETFTPLQL